MQPSLDDLLREASDPTTSGERLRELWHWLFDDEDIEQALIRNPSLPLDLLRQVLIRSGSGAWYEPAWHNPIVPTLLLSEPSPDYQDAARRLLASLSPQLPPDSSLEELISEWSRSVGASSRAASDQASALARRLATLFGLPWP